jgi:3-hydroxyacyl-CoA dehydrogenase
MLERGDATIEDIDTAMKLGAGYRQYTFAFNTDFPFVDLHYIYFSYGADRIGRLCWP